MKGFMILGVLLMTGTLLLGELEGRAEEGDGPASVTEINGSAGDHDARSPDTDSGARPRGRERDASTPRFCSDPNRALCGGTKGRPSEPPLRGLVKKLTNATGQKFLRETIGDAYLDWLKREFPRAPLSRIRNTFRRVELHLGPKNAAEQAYCAKGAGAFQYGMAIEVCSGDVRASSWQYILSHEAGHVMEQVLAQTAPDVLRKLNADAERLLPTRTSGRGVASAPSSADSSACPVCGAPKAAPGSRAGGRRGGSGNLHERLADMMAARMTPFYLARMTGREIPSGDGRPTIDHVPKIRPAELASLWNYRCGAVSDPVHPSGPDVIEKYLGTAPTVRAAIGCPKK